ncbi:LysR family transcriptional regulator [Acidithiobacillus albertensis]|uniref:LysR family transcriptional regulator n=1 Tax=Acidithiobacillus albertensis TaxID=119978 RepID=UPI00094AAC27|nr:LysR family transcriptional regulator [Acidithiobacillus albertensis]
MEDLNDLYYYVQAVEHGGFAPAARAINLPKSKLSRRVAGLEERLGVRLIQRSTRHFTVTEIGQIYYTHCKAMLVEAEGAQEAIDSVKAEPAGVLRLTCPVALLHLQVSTMLADFMAQYPRVTLLLEASNRRVDLLGEGVDVAIRVRPPPLPDSELIQRILAERSQCLVVSPTLGLQARRIQQPDDLVKLPSMGLGSLQQNHHWELFGPQNAVVIRTHQPRFVTTDMIALRDAAIAGAGVVQLPLLMVREALTTGTLMRILPAWVPHPELIHAVFPSRRGLLPAVRALIDFLAARFAELQEDSPHF